MISTALSIASPPYRLLLKFPRTRISADAWGQLLEGTVHRRVRQTPVKLQEEQILPAPSRQRAGLQLHQVQPVDGKDGEYLMEAAHLVRKAEDRGDLVRPLPQLHHRGDHHEAGGVVAVVVDSPGQNLQAIQLRRPAGTDGRLGDIPGLGHILSAARRVPVGHPHPAGMPGQEGLALEEPCSWE